MPTTLNLDTVVQDIQRIIDETGCAPEELTVRDYSKHGGNFDGRSLRKLGGFASIVKDAFPESFHSTIANHSTLAKRNAYVASLEKKLAQYTNFENTVAEAFKRALAEVAPVQISKLNKKTLKSGTSGACENVALLSDTHFGLRISREEVGSNEYNWGIAARRLGKFTDQIATFKKEHRDKAPQLRLCLGGDIGQGIIHWMTDEGTDNITTQMVGIYGYLINMIDHLRHFYKKIVVECTSDNHMRMVHKGPDRTTAQKYDNFSTPIYVALQGAFRTCPDVEFHITKSPISTFYVLGHKFGLTHGDTHIDTGNVGSIINVKSIGTQVMALNAAEKTGKYKALLLGHVHTPVRMALASTGTDIVVNGTMSGSDSYSSSRGFFGSISTQVLFESTSEYAVGDFRVVNLNDADADSKYESIITPYDGRLGISSNSFGR